MKRVFLTLLFSASLLLAATTDPFATISPTDRKILDPAIKRYATDEMKMNWADLFEIDEQDISRKRDFLLKDDAPPLNKPDYVTHMNEALDSGGKPVLTSFQLTSVTKQDSGFLVSACAASKREAFHFKGTIEFSAHIRDGKAAFGSWSYKYSMPHSCSRRGDSE